MTTSAKFVKYILSSNAGEIGVMLAAPLVGMPLPLLPLQILWINLVTDGLPSLALSLEPAERDIMRRPPYNPTENIPDRGMDRDVLWIGLLIALLSLGPGYGLWRLGQATWQTMVFTTLTLAQMANALALRSERHALIRIGWRSNQALLGAVALTIALQGAVVYIPFWQRVFKITALSVTELMASLLLGAVVLTTLELVKW